MIREERYTSGATAVVKTKSAREYIRELLSNSSVSVLSEHSKPKEKAPRMLEMAAPMMLPTARDDRPCASDATTTANYFRQPVSSNTVDDYIV